MKINDIPLDPNKGDIIQSQRSDIMFIEKIIGYKNSGYIVEVLAFNDNNNLPPVSNNLKTWGWINPQWTSADEIVKILSKKETIKIMNEIAAMKALEL